MAKSKITAPLVDVNKKDAEEKMKRREIIIDAYENVRKGYTFNAPTNGKKQRLYIAWPDTLLFDKFRSLPIDTRLYLFGGSIEQMQAYIDGEKYKIHRELRKLVKVNWYWRDTGEPFFLHEMEDIPDTGLSGTELLKKCNRKKTTLTPAQINAAINFFTGDRSEIYQKDDN